VCSRSRNVNEARIWQEREQDQQCDAENDINNYENENKDETSETEWRLMFNIRHSSRHTN